MRAIPYSTYRVDPPAGTARVSVGLLVAGESWLSHQGWVYTIVCLSEAMRRGLNGICPAGRRIVFCHHTQSLEFDTTPDDTPVTPVDVRVTYQEKA